MGRLIDGKWVTQDLGTDAEGNFVRRAAKYRARPTADGSSGLVAEHDALQDELQELPMMRVSYATWVKGESGERSAQILADKVERADRLAGEHPDLHEAYQRKAAYFSRFRDSVYDEARVRAAHGQVRRALDAASARLSDAPFLAGDEPGYADCILVTALYRLADLGVVDDWAQDLSHPLRRYFERFRERPSYARVFVHDPNIPQKYRRDGSPPGVANS